MLRRLASIGLWNWPGRTQHATRSLLAGKPKQTKPTSGTERRAEVTRANILSRVERRNQKLATRVQALDKPRAPGPQGQWEKDSETETRTKLVQMCEFGIHSLLVKAVKLLSSSKLTSRCGHEVRLDQSARLDWAESWLILLCRATCCQELGVEPSHNPKRQKQRRVIANYSKSIKAWHPYFNGPNMLNLLSFANLLPNSVEFPARVSVPYRANRRPTTDQSARPFTFHRGHMMECGQG